jgi:phosphatidylglycerol:prolipoprotein diacylglycerol transferase
VRFVETTPFGPMLGPPRHPTQIYEAILEGIFLFAILWWMFWKTKARYAPGKLVGAF